MSKVKCIILEDDPLFIKVLEAYVHEMDFIELAGSYQDPVKGAVAIAKFKPDLLLLDIEMPYLDGLETLETINTRPRIIVISSRLDLVDNKDEDIDMFINKRDLVSPEQLAEAIKQVMSL